MQIEPKSTKNRPPSFPKKASPSGASAKGMIIQASHDGRFCPFIELGAQCLAECSGGIV